jgi:GNAT superfamily N-acetyltransferase
VTRRFVEISTVRFVQDTHPLRALLEEAARGRFPPPDGAVRVMPAPPGRFDAVVAFTAHHVIAADVEPDETLAHLPSPDLGAPVNAEFLAWLGSRLGSPPGSLDVVLGAPGLLGASADPLLREAGRRTHDRVDRAERYREGVSVYSDPDETAVVVLGSGLAGRREISLEVDEAARGRGLGRRLVLAARTLVPRGESVFAQVAPGNAASLRAFLAAGFTPIGSEVLFLRGWSG